MQPLNVVFDLFIFLQEMDGTKLNVKNMKWQKFDLVKENMMQVAL